jgi:hypothetical protein
MRACGRPARCLSYLAHQAKFTRTSAAYFCFEVVRFLKFSLR